MKTLKKILYSTGILLGLVLVIFLCTGFIQVGLEIFGNSMNMTISEDTLYSISGTLGILFAGIFASVFAKKKSDRSVGNDLQKQKFCMKKALLYSISAICICRVFFDVVTTILFAQIAPITYEQLINSNIYIDGLCALILAPIGEELLFRSGLYSLLRRNLKVPVAVIFVAVVFGIMHFYNVLGFASCFLAGVFFTLIYERTGNVWFCVFTHTTCNLFSFIMNMMEKMEIPIQYEVNGYNTYHIGVVVAAFLFCGTAFYLRKFSQKQLMNFTET